MTFLFQLAQWTWGLPQSLLGFILFLCNAKGKHYLYHGAIITVWKSKSSLSLGAFVFITDEPYFYDKLKNDYTLQELNQRLLVHEYGHTVQSLILGPLYLPVMGIPSTLWGFLPYCYNKRKAQNLSYFHFFTERWANALGERVTKSESMEQLVID